MTTMASVAEPVRQDTEVELGHLINYPHLSHPLGHSPATVRFRHLSRVKCWCRQNRCIISCSVIGRSSPCPLAATRSVIRRAIIVLVPYFLYLFGVFRIPVPESLASRGWPLQHRPLFASLMAFAARFRDRINVAADCHRCSYPRPHLWLWLCVHSRHVLCGYSSIRLVCSAKSRPARR